MTKSRQVADFGAGGFYAGKNKVINGDFSIWQRGTSFSTGNGAYVYSADRWAGYFYASNATTMSQQAFTAGSAPVAGYEAQYFLRISSTSNSAYLIQRIEDVRTLAGQTVTLSFWAKSASNQTLAAVELGQEFGTGGSTAVYTTLSSSQAITTSWARYTFTATLPSISGKTIGTGSNLTIGIRGAINNALDIWGVQLEAGQVATPFQTATGTLAGELAACQRYYYKVTPTATYQDILNGSTNDSTAYARYCMKFPVTMRTAPTMGTTGTAGDYGNLVKTGFAGATGVPTSNDSRVDGITIYLTSASIATGDAPCLRNSTGGVNSNNWLTFSSEL